MSVYKEASEKLEREAKAGKFGQKENAMKAAVVSALKSFCRQSEELCDRVIKGGSFEECMRAVAKDVGSSISDIEAYRRAVAYYWKEAKISFVMKIEGAGTAGEEKEESKADEVSAVNDNDEAVELIDLSDFL